MTEILAIQKRLVLTHTALVYSDKQWGYLKINSTASEIISLPITMNTAYIALAGDMGAGAFPLGASADKTTLHVFQQATQQIFPIIEGWWFCIGKVNVD